MREPQFLVKLARDDYRNDSADIAETTVAIERLKDLWRQLRSGRPTWKEYERFLMKHSGGLDESEIEHMLTWDYDDYYA